MRCAKLIQQEHLIVNGVIVAEMISKKVMMIKMNLPYTKNQVVIEVSGGVAEVVRCPNGIEVLIIDHDNEMNGE